MSVFSYKITLVHFFRDQITLTKFLGSGAFGEVFEGKARGISNTSGETKVAVKVGERSEPYSRFNCLFITDFA